MHLLEASGVVTLVACPALNGVVANIGRAAINSELKNQPPPIWRQVLSGSVRNVTCAEMPVLLDPGAYVSCLGHYVLTQEDIDESMVTNEVGFAHACMVTNSCMFVSNFEVVRGGLGASALMHSI